MRPWLGFAEPAQISGKPNCDGAVYVYTRLSIADAGPLNSLVPSKPHINARFWTKRPYSTANS